jgi:hypothetical protein
LAGLGTFLLGLGGWAAAFGLLWGLVFWFLKDLPQHPADRGWRVARLHHDRSSRRSRETLAAALDWLDARLSPEFPDDPALAKTEAARAWSGPHPTLRLLRAVACPCFMGPEPGAPSDLPESPRSPLGPRRPALSPERSGSVNSGSTSPTQVSC